jgi:hypothetical protein
MFGRLDVVHKQSFAVRHVVLACRELVALVVVEDTRIPLLEADVRTGAFVAEEKDVGRGYFVKEGDF